MRERDVLRQRIARFAAPDDVVGPSGRILAASPDLPLAKAILREIEETARCRVLRLRHDDSSELVLLVKAGRILGGHRLGPGLAESARGIAVVANLSSDNDDTAKDLRLSVQYFLRDARRIAVSASVPGTDPPLTALGLLPDTIITDQAQKEDTTQVDPIDRLLTVCGPLLRAYLHVRGGEIVATRGDNTEVAALSRIAEAEMSAQDAGSSDGSCVILSGQSSQSSAVLCGVIGGGMIFAVLPSEGLAGALENWQAIIGRDR